MPARPIANGSISFGLVSIPVKLFAATRSKAIRFHMVHAKDKSRIQQKIYCPADDAIVDRSELVRGYEVEKGTIVTFTNEELEKLEARGDHMIDIKEFVPLEQVDPMYFENSYHLGCSAESARAYRLLAEALKATQHVAVARYTMRAKEYLVLIRPYEKGLMLHTMYYADEIAGIEDIDRGQATKVGDQELELAKRLISDLTKEKFEPNQFQDTYRERVQAAAQEKVEGHEAVAAAPPEERRAKVINLYDALRASLEKRGVQMGEGKAGESESRAAQGDRAQARNPRRTAESARARRK